MKIPIEIILFKINSYCDNFTKFKLNQLCKKTRNKIDFYVECKIKLNLEKEEKKINPNIDPTKFKFCQFLFYEYKKQYKFRINYSDKCLKKINICSRYNVIPKKNILEYIYDISQCNLFQKKKSLGPRQILTKMNKIYPNKIRYNVTIKHLNLSLVRIFRLIATNNKFKELYCCKTFQNFGDILCYFDFGKKNRSVIISKSQISIINEENAIKNIDFYKNIVFLIKRSTFNPIKIF